ncbi:DUF6470 family protein [Petroclostridium sp. X23]|uniref:DUF6470 family protein n=1 Tax=Petroclostridium sp. X23 TaxID=3045146 RepID=UPI0024ADA19A|nr:DUF6470 family protein [Petroclostridium sp. X23]WHH61517.1 DUF6470 family protein [Petroclostridium sp. X23]
MLQITQTYARIGIETKNTQLNMKSTPPRLDIRQENAKVEIESELPKVQIDQYQCFAEAGLKNNMDLLKEASQLASQQVMQYISKTVADGHTLASIENGSNPIPNMAVRDAYPEKQFNIGFIPKSRPKIEVTGDIKFNYQPGAVQYDYQPGQVDIQASRPEINIYLEQEASIQFKYAGKNVDIRL